MGSRGAGKKGLLGEIFSPGGPFLLHREKKCGIMNGQLQERRAGRAALRFGDVPKWLKGPHSKCGRRLISAREFESLHLRQLRNSHHRSVSGFAENCAMMGISSLSSRKRSAGLREEVTGDGGRETKDERRGTGNRCSFLLGADRLVRNTVFICYGIVLEWGNSRAFLFLAADRSFLFFSWPVLCIFLGGFPLF